MKQIISHISSVDEFYALLQNNPGLVIIKFGAEWCGPCKKIAHIVEGFFATSPPTVVCADLNVDESFELYGFLKSRKMVNGIPAILMYRADKTVPGKPFIPFDSCVGADPVQLDAFFKRCGNHLVDAQQNMARMKPQIKAETEH